MIKNKYDEVVKRFEEYYSYLWNQAVDWWPSGRRCITVKLEDGTMVEFNPFDDTIRTISPDIRTRDVEYLKKDIGHNLKKIVLTRGIPQSEIASKCGITEAMLSRYIHGTSMPGIDKLYNLAAVLDCRVVDILGDFYES
jgi:DNA-binding Xre family transcriptional regulator